MKDPAHHGLAMVKLSDRTFALSLCLVKEGFFLGKQENL
jgi:hypothetical protein